MGRSIDPDPRPAPPWDADVNLTVFGTVDVPALMMTGPGFSALAGSDFKAAVYLLMRAWHEVPAGSLPNDSATLAVAAGFGDDRAAWELAAPRVLSGWTYCTDDRFYFLPWADTIRAAWDRRTKRKASKNDAMQRARLKAAMVEIGVPAERLGIAVMRQVCEAAELRGIKDTRGQGRVDLLTRIASDLGLFPSDVPHDARLDFTMRSVRPRPVAG